MTGMKPSIRITSKPAPAPASPPSASLEALPSTRPPPNPAPPPPPQSRLVRDPALARWLARPPTGGRCRYGHVPDLVEMTYAAYECILEEVQRAAMSRNEPQ